MTARGFASIEWLLAAALVTTVAASLFAVITPVRDVVERTHHRVDLAGAARGALDLLIADVREAGSSPFIAPQGVALTSAISPVSIGDGSSITIVAVPPGGAQGRLALAASDGATSLSLFTAARCRTGPPTCDFRPGHRALLFTSERSEVVTVASVAPGLLTLSAPLTEAFPADAVLCQLATTTYGLRGPVGHQRLVRTTDGGAEQPLHEDVVTFAVEADHPDPARVRRVFARLRVQTPAGHLRGPQGFLFAFGGTATSMRRWLPDIEVRAVMSLRNAGERP